MLIAFWIVVPMLTYLFMVGVSWKTMQMFFIGRCGHCELRDGKWKHYGYHGMKIYGYGQQWNNSFHMHSNAGMWSLVWPFMIPVLLGQAASDRKSVKANKDEQRRHNELTEAKHQAELARLRRIEDEELTRQLQDKVS